MSKDSYAKKRSGSIFMKNTRSLFLVCLFLFFNETTDMWHLCSRYLED